MARAVVVLLVLLTYQVASADAAIEDEAVDDESRSSSSVPLWVALGGAVAGGASVSFFALANRQAAPRSATASDVRPAPQKAARDPALDARLARSDEVAPRWVRPHSEVRGAALWIRLTNDGSGRANRVRAFGLDSEGPASAQLAPELDGEISIEPGASLTVEFAGSPARVSFHLAYEDDVGLVWWCPVSYWALAAAPVQLGLLERDRPA